jgi:hypothetical protein
MKAHARLEHDQPFENARIKGWTFATPFYSVPPHSSGTGNQNHTACEKFHKGRNFVRFRGELFILPACARSLGMICLTGQPAFCFRSSHLFF